MMPNTVERRTAWLSLPQLRRGDLPSLSIVLLAAGVVHAWIAAWDFHATTFTDSMDYLFMADFYRARVFGGEWELAAEYYRQTRFPPLFPLILGLTGGGTEHQHAAAIASNLIAWLAAAATWWWVRNDRGPAIGAFVAVGTVLFPWYFALNLSPVSEPLGLLMCASALALLAREPLTRGRVLAAALIIGAAPLARTALLPLVIAFSIWLAIRRPLPGRQAVLALLAAWSPYLAWSLYRRAIGAHQYSAYLNAAKYNEEGIILPQALWQQPLRLLEAFVQGWGTPTPPAWLVVLSGAVVLMATLGCLIRLRENRLDAWFLAGYVALILLWPFPEEHTRFTVAVYPFVLLCAISAARSLDRLIGRGWPVQAALLVAVVALCLPAWTKFARRAATSVPVELLGEKREPAYFILDSDADAAASMEINGRARLLLRTAGQNMPDGACLYSLPPQLGRLYSRRKVLAYPQGLGSDLAAADAALRHCDYFFLGAWKSRVYEIPEFYPSRSLEGWTETVLVSNMRFRDRTLTAAALRKRTAPAAAAVPPTANPVPDR